jgi:hypothetical protein
VAFEDDELLVALERFEGVLIASTNLFDEHHIEPAAGSRRYNAVCAGELSSSDCAFRIRKPIRWSTRKIS